MGAALTVFTEGRKNPLDVLGEGGQIGLDKASSEQRRHQQRDEENPQKREQIRPVHGLTNIIAYATK